MQLHTLRKIGNVTRCSGSPLDMPFCRSQSIALDVSPSQAFSASLQSSMGAPVRSRKIFTSAADTAAKRRTQTARNAVRQMGIIFGEVEWLVSAEHVQGCCFAVMCAGFCCAGMHICMLQNAVVKEAAEGGPMQKRRL
jgi:hypothetical protein